MKNTFQTTLLLTALAVFLLLAGGYIGGLDCSWPSLLL
jgi:hypothetical protein